MCCSNWKNLLVKLISDLFFSNLQKHVIYFYRIKWAFKLECGWPCFIYNKAITSKLEIDWNNFNSFRQSYSKLFRKKKSSFYKNIIRSESTFSKKLWKKLDPYLNPNKITKVSPSLIINDTYYNTPADVASTFSNFFHLLSLIYI